MTLAEARTWGRGDARRLTTADFPAEVLELVDARQGGRCCTECRRLGLATPATEPLEVDHLLALARGGDNRWENLQWLCRAHNRAKGDRPRCPPSPPTWARGLAP
jgi:5-methylcytosine-specific restriction endonuclease McrA